jgi:hypothetical protein
MPRKVLLVDANVHALGPLASELRARGLNVSNASEVFDAVEEAFRSRPDVVLFAERIDGAGDLRAAFLAVPELAHTPLLHLVRAEHTEDRGPDSIPRADLDQLVARIATVSPRAERAALDQEIRGHLEQMPLGDLLQFLSMNRKSGVLGVTTPTGTGEVRLADGEVVGASYRRLEGEKALFRLFGERAGRFAFSAGGVSAVRHIAVPTGQLLMESMRQVDEARRRRSELAPAGEALRLIEPPTLTSAGRDVLSAALGLVKTASTFPVGPVAGELAELLQIPRTLDEILDEIDAPDLVILEGLNALVTAKRIRRIPLADLTTPFAAPAKLPVLRSLITRLTLPGFASPPRLLIAAEPSRLPTLTHSLRRITDIVVPPSSPPSALVPRLLGTLRLGDDVSLAIIGIPTGPMFTPTWALALPGAAVVVRLDSTGGPALEAHCRALEIMLIDAERLSRSLDLTVPARVASLMRAALEMASGV